MSLESNTRNPELLTAPLPVGEETTNCHFQQSRETCFATWFPTYRKNQELGVPGIGTKTMQMPIKARGPNVLTQPPWPWTNSRMALLPLIMSVMGTAIRLAISGAMRTTYSRSFTDTARKAFS